MLNRYNVTNADLRADAEITRKQSFAGVPHSAKMEQSERIYVPANTEIKVTFGGNVPDLCFKMGDTPAWSDMIVAAIRRNPSYLERLAKRTTKAEPCITFTGRTLPRKPQPKLQGVYPKYAQARPDMGMA